MKRSDMLLIAGAGRCTLVLLIVAHLVALVFETALADGSTGDHLWNIRDNGDDRFHSNESWLRPWRYDYDDGWG